MQEEPCRAACARWSASSSRQEQPHCSIRTSRMPHLGLSDQEVRGDDTVSRRGGKTAGGAERMLVWKAAIEVGAPTRSASAQR
jgi:hypothetical protein